MSNITIDLCHYMLNGNSMFLDLFLDDVKKSSNIVHKCPFKVSQLLVISLQPILNLACK